MSLAIFCGFCQSILMSDSGLTHAGTLVLPQRGKTSLEVLAFALRKIPKAGETVPASAKTRPALSQPLISHLSGQ